jgi:transketolase
MLHEDTHLHFDALNPGKLPESAVRDGFGVGLLEVAAKDERVVVVCADVTQSVRVQAFKDQFPDRYIEVGVAEQNMAGVASGLAAVGKIPFITSFGMFSPGRNWEQIRTTIALNEQPVQVIGHHTGVTVGPDGATHQALEDITLMRVMPNMRVVVPMDAEEARKAVHAMVADPRPTYLRCARNKTPVCTTPETPFSLGSAYYLFRAPDSQLTFIGAGPILYRALLVAEKLMKRGIGSSVLNVHTLKPIGIELVLEAMQESGAVVSVEDHQILGGVGSTLAEIAAQNTPVPIEMVAVHDRFGQSGTADELEEEYKLSRDAIEQAAQRVLSRK